MLEFETACLQGNIDLANDLLLHHPNAAGQSGASFLSRLISLLEDMPIGVGIMSENIDSLSSTDEEILEYEKKKASREELITRRIRESSQNKNIRGCLRRAIVKTLKIAIKAIYIAKSATIFELLLLLIRVLESPRLHYDINYDIARALIKYGGLSSKDISSLVIVSDKEEEKNQYIDKQTIDQNITKIESTIPSISKESTIPSISKTPLHAAVTSGCFELCWLLVERFGAVQSLRMKDTPGGRTPSQLAALFEFTEISDWLLEQESELIDKEGRVDEIASCLDSL
jgi:hypothetical protein